MEEKSKQLQEQFRLTVGDDYYEYCIKKWEQQNVLTAQEYGRKYGTILNKLMTALENKYHPESAEVQNLIEEHWEILQIVYPETRSQKIYFVIRDQLCDVSVEEKETLAFFDFLYKAMTTFGQQYFPE